MRFDDQWLQEIASQYAESDGRQLKAEMEGIKDNSQDFERLDFITKKSIRRQKVIRYSPAIGAAAACLAALLLSTSVVDNFNSGMPLPEAVMDGAGSSEKSMISLSLNLPDRFQVTSEEQDRGETIYHISEQLGDDVVLSVKEALDQQQNEDLKEISIHGSQVRALALDEYKIITFQKDNLQYTLTCQYEFSTLVELCESLL